METKPSIDKLSYNQIEDDENTALKKVAKQQIDLDDILIELGDFGKFQIKFYILLPVASILLGTYLVNYMLISANPQYRCLIPECENKTNSSNLEFIPDWLKTAVPFKENNFPAKCEKYLFINNSTTLTLDGMCIANSFNKNITVSCGKHYVIDDQLPTIAPDFNLFCGEEWKLTLTGSVHNTGQLISYFITGILSDKFGRRNILAIGLFLGAIFGLCRSLSPSYIWYQIFEFLDAAASNGVFTTSATLATELVTPSKRSLITTLVCIGYPLGIALSTFYAWLVHYSWRLVLQIIYVPGLLSLMYFWLLPESYLWLMSKGRHKECKTLIFDIAKQNNVQLSDRALESLNANINNAKEKKIYEDTQSVKFTDILKNGNLLLRLILCAVCWITSTFCFYGILLYSMELSGNIFINFSLGSLMDVPAVIIFYFTIDRFGRKLTFSSAYLICGIACITYIVVPPDLAWLRFICFLAAKFAIAIAYTVIVLYTVEMFPTSVRQSTLGICLGAAGFGAIAAPQTPLLSQFIWEPLPMLVFGILSISSCLLSLTFPETLHTTLPDTIDEAIKIGKKRRQL